MASPLLSNSLPSARLPLRQQRSVSPIARACRHSGQLRQPNRLLLHVRRFRDFDGIDWITKRQALPGNSATFAFNRNPDNVLNAIRVDDDGDLQDWFGGRPSFALSEDVIGVGSYERTPTVLYGIEVPDDEEDDEESLIQSYTPRFRRR
jgi:hypothetical protein